ncbi:hypothetical protein CD797_01885 [Pseudomonas aeruginosa]|nr:hypothetical protein CD797_01885 [Pseudomonas aeruginosa]
MVSPVLSDSVAHEPVTQNFDTLAHYGAIISLDDLKANLAANCLPDDLAAYQPEQFETFLTERRRLMAQKIKQYYWGL